MLIVDCYLNFYLQFYNSIFGFSEDKKRYSWSRFMRVMFGC